MQVKSYNLSVIINNQSLNLLINNFTCKKGLMSLQIQSITHRWLTSIGVLNQQDKENIKKTQNNTFIIDQELANKFQNGLKLGNIVQELYKKNGMPIPNSMNHLKTATHTAAMLYNWNIINDSLKKIGFQIDSQTKSMVINGDRDHLNMVLRNLQVFYQKGGNSQSANRIEDSLDNEKVNQISNKNKENTQTNQKDEMYKQKNQNIGGMKDSMSLSYSEDQPFGMSKKQSIVKKQDSAKKDQNKVPQNILSPQGDLLEYIVNQLMVSLKLTKKQAVALLADNNKYLAHVLVKGIKGQFIEIDELMQKFYMNIDYIIEKMVGQNDMCFFFLQIVKPSLLSKSEEIAQWGCRILSKVANELAERQMLPLAYDWFVREAGGLSTTILALSRHPKLNQHVVAYILEFARYNVTELFTIELKKITNNDNLNYMKFMLLIFDPLVESKLSAEELLTSGAIDYWVEMAIKNSQSNFNNSKELRLYSIEFLIKIWRAYPLHIQETLDMVNTIMINIKKGILESSQIMRFSLLQIMFNLLDQFASKKNPYASILYKKLTFLFVQNHEQETMREFILSNLEMIFKKFSSIPVEIFLQPFIKQVKITESKSYFLQIFDMNFIKSAVQHRKLKVNAGIELYDLLAKIKLNNNCYVEMANESMGILLDRFLEDQLFFDYTVKLVKISLAMFYSTLKHKKPHDDHERIQAQKRAEIVNFIISLVERENQELNEEIKNLVVHVKVQILNRLGITHKGIERILTFFPDAEQAVDEAMQSAEQTSSNATSKTKSQFHLPKIESRNQIIRERQRQRERDEVTSQQSNQSSNSKLSRVTNGSNKEFEMKPYSRYADDNQKNFMKELNIQPTDHRKQIDIKKKKTPLYLSTDKQQQIDPKLQSQIDKYKERKEQQQARKIKQKQILQRKKQILKQKIQKELEQRNIKEGIKGNQKDVQVKVVFEENELNEKLFQNTQQEEEVYFYKNVSLDDEEQRDTDSIRLVMKKNLNFVKKIFTKYACAKVVKKDYFEQKTDMSHTDLLRLCKQKNLEKSKTPILEIMKQVNNKNMKSINIDAFPWFLENLCVFLYNKEKCSTHIPMGDFLRQRILKKMAVGQNVKLDDQQDQQTKQWSQKVRYNPQIELPENFKKVTERIYYPNKECSYPVKKAINNENFLTCFEVLNEIIFDIFKFNILQEEVRFKEQLKVVPKKQAYLPPKPVATKQQKQTDEGSKGLLLKETQTAPLKKRESSVSKMVASRASQNIDKQTPKRLVSTSKQKPKVLNAAEKKKIEEEQNERIKREHQQQIRKIRQLQVKKKLEKQKEQREKQKQQKKQEEKKKKLEEQEKKKQQDQQQELYKQKQKQKLQKYRKQQEQKEQAQKERRKKEREREQQQKKQKITKLKVKQEQKRQEEKQKVKKDRQLSEQNKKKQKDEEQKRKQMLRKQVLKKLGSQKEKYEIEKTLKQLTKQVFNESSITEIFNQNKEQLKAMWNYGKQYNEYKLGMNPTQQALQSKGFITLCQQFSICDVPTANKLLKTHQKETGMTGFSYEQFQETLFSFNIKPVLQKEMQNYGNAVKQSQKVISRFITKLNIPKDKLLLKDFFLNLKNEKNENTKKRKQSAANEQVQITNSKGEKQNWQIQNDDQGNQS